MSNISDIKVFSFISVFVFLCSFCVFICGIFQNYSHAIQFENSQEVRVDGVSQII